MLAPCATRQHAGVRQEHDRRLEALGAMHRHDADLVALLLHVALDLDVGRAQRIDEALQRWRRLPVKREREIEKLIERLGGFRPKPRQHALAHLLPILAKQLEEEFVRRREIDAGEPARQTVGGFLVARIVLGLALQHVPQRRVALVSEIEQVVVIEPEERALQHHGKR